MSESNEDRFCGECMHLIAPSTNPDVEEGHGCNPTAAEDIREEFDPRQGPGKWIVTVPGAKACVNFHPSIAAQQVEQMRIANELRVLRLSLAIAAETPGQTPDGLLEKTIYKAAGVRRKIRNTP